jgi:hypothetical protein
LAISSWPEQNRLNPSLVPVSLRLIGVLFPASRNALIASFMIGNTVLEPPILMGEALLPAPWARDCAWASGENARTALHTAAICMERMGRLGRLGVAMAINSRSGKENNGN